MTYDQALVAMSRESLLALCSHQGEQITRLLRERSEATERIEASFERRHALQRQKIEKQAAELNRLRKQLDQQRKGAG